MDEEEYRSYLAALKEIEEDEKEEEKKPEPEAPVKAEKEEAAVSCEQMFLVTGMSCAACAARVEKAAASVSGVASASVNLLTNSLLVTGQGDPKEIMTAVEKAGYQASLKTDQKESEEEPAALTEEPDPAAPLFRRLIASLGFLAVLLYCSMGIKMWGFPTLFFLPDNPLALSILEMLLAVTVMIINRDFFIRGAKGLWHLAPNMDTLVALGSGCSALYSLALVLSMTDLSWKGDQEAVRMLYHDLYWESAAMILTLITVGKLMEAKAKGRTTDALKALIKLAPKKARVLSRLPEEGEDPLHLSKEIPAIRLQVGDIFWVKAGEEIPADGVVLLGESAVNEAALTGESMPVEKEKDDRVMAASVNTNGVLICRAERVGKDTGLAKIIEIISRATATKAPIARMADKVSAVFVPTVMGIALLTFVIWLLAGKELSFALARGICVLVISCPCALGLATPVAVMVGSGVGAREGILFKDAATLELTGKAKKIILDKTGTITEGSPLVTDILSETLSEERLLGLLASLEQMSEHPLAKAVCKEADRRGIGLLPVTGFEEKAGCGVEGVVDGLSLRAGKAGFAGTGETDKKVSRLLAEGKTVLYLGTGELSLGVVALRDEPRPGAGEAIKELSTMGISVSVLTGDKKETAQAIGKELGVSEVMAELMPEDKASVVERLSKEGTTIMVGDGINDAPALAMADVGMAIGAGTEVAVSTAQVVLVKSRLSDVVTSVRLSRAVMKNIRENLFWAFFYNVCGIPIAAGVFSRFGLTLTPMVGALAMSLSSFCVVMNALRLYHFKGSAAGKEKENTVMKKVMVIEGMMCGHCEMTVKKALEAVPGVTLAEANHEKGSATVTLSSEVADEVLKQAVEAKDYTVKSIS